MYLIEIMPEYHRASHRAARNWGVYPANGAERYLVSSDEFLPDDGGEYNRVVREATADDLDNYAEL